MAKKAVLFLTTGFEETEALVTADVLRRGGIELTIASLTGDKIVTGSHDITVITDDLFENVKDIIFNALILPGGPGTSRYFEHDEFAEYIKKSGKSNEMLLAAICAAPGFFGSLGLLDGKRATCFPGHEDKLTGAIFTGSASETDGNIITGRSAGCVFDFALAVLGYLCGSETAEKVRAAMIYKS